MSWWWWIPIVLVGVPLAGTVLLCIACVLTDCKLCEEPDGHWRG